MPTATPMIPPAAPISAARARLTAISWARLTPSARSVPYSAASRKLSRASSWPVTSRPITPNSAASSHNATACGLIERSVFTDWTAEQLGLDELSVRTLAEFPPDRRPVPAAVPEPQRDLDESGQGRVVPVERGRAPRDEGAVARLRRELGLRGVDPRDAEHERHPP